jgi:hypothetical protein
VGEIRVYLDYSGYLGLFRYMTPPVCYFGVYILRYKSPNSKPSLISAFIYIIYLRMLGNIAI